MPQEPSRGRRQKNDVQGKKGGKLKLKVIKNLKN
jgi:hypothetical protein